ncbi:hypothetical protein [Pseudonocardia acaciae]|uniref:hypothetical protein n=1 Tax=Pseudonocardia acaciae TaxID=551276 RepID=UPI0006871CDF|nr:hypothetical protein [Pseudonocardia acaciae]
MTAEVTTAREGDETPPPTPLPSVPPPPPSSASSPPPDAAESAVPDVAMLPKVLKLAGAVVAPTTMLTALLFYFGRMYAGQTFDYFGVHMTALDLKAEDFLMRSADGLIFPLVVAASIAVLALWAHQILFRSVRAATRRIALRILIPASALAGASLVSLAVIDVVAATPVFPAYPETRGLNFAGGVLLLAYSARLARIRLAQRRPGQTPRRPPAAAMVEWGALFFLVSVGVFWAAGSYASSVGYVRAWQIEAALPTTPTVTLYSEKSLSLKAAGVLEIACGPDAAYRFAYDGLKLVVQSGNQYLLLPPRWRHANGTAILIPRSQTIRLEFRPPNLPPRTTC